VVQFAAFVLATYVAIITAMYIAQTWLLFPTTLAGLARVQLPASAQRIEIRTPDRETLVGVRIPPLGEPGGPVPTLVGFGGNAWNAEAMALSLHGLFPDREVVAFHYRGYGPSSGSPTADALLADSLVIFDDLRQAGVRQRVITIGFSLLGCAPTRRWVDSGHALRLAGAACSGSLLVGSGPPSSPPSHADH
jgi:uncharacterized protein